MFLFTLILTTAFFSGCTISDADFSPKREVSSYTEKAITVEGPFELYITGDSSNVEIYTHDNNEFKLEITKRIRGIQEKSVLEKKLENFDISLNQEADKITFESEYKGTIKNAADVSVDLKIYIPKKVRYIKYKLDIGNIKIFDDIKCNFDAGINMVNIDINRFEGKIDIKGNLGSVRVSNGRIEGTSSIVLNMGNISIKSEHKDGGNYNYETKMGNVDLWLPNNSNVTLEKFGTIETDEFPSASGPTKIRVCSEMGKIAVRKY